MAKDSNIFSDEHQEPEEQLEQPEQPQEEQEEQDVAWREFNIHNPKGHDNDSLEEDEGTPFVVNLFETESSYEIYEFAFPSTLALSAVDSIDEDKDKPTSDTKKNNLIMLKIRGKEEEGVSTGLGLWSGSEALCQYLATNREARTSIQNACSVLELGAGLGLCGIFCHRVLQANQVYITDGDLKVLDNLRFNVQQNLASEHENQQLRVSCPQLIWDKDLDNFTQRYGRQPVIIASDVIYLTQSLEPFWKTVDALLIQNNDENDTSNRNGTGVLYFVNKSTSQASVHMILDMARKYGFTWQHNSPDEEIDNLRNAVFTFQRRRE